MKKSLLLAGVLAAPLCFSTAFAGDEATSSFHALGGVSANAMTDRQLDAVDGQSRRVKVCVVCTNVAFVKQANIAIGSAFVTQINNVSQSNN